MTQYPDFNGRKKQASVIPAACLALLTLGSISVYGFTEFSLVPAMLIIITLAFSLMVISRFKKS